MRRHGHELQVYAGRLLGAEGRAEDALQHALMNAWVALRDRDATVANPRAWLYGIVHNSAVTVLRRARHDTVALNEALDTPHGHAGPEVRVVVGEILAGLAEMPDIQRRALVMTAVAGSSHEEAASALGVSGGAVRGMVYRARAALRQAAAALLPAPLWSWAARFGQRRARVPVDPRTQPRRSPQPRRPRRGLRRWSSRAARVRALQRPRARRRLVVARSRRWQQEGLRRDVGFF